MNTGKEISMELSPMVLAIFAEVGEKLILAISPSCCISPDLQEQIWGVVRGFGAVERDKIYACLTLAYTKGPSHPTKHFQNIFEPMQWE